MTTTGRRLLAGWIGVGGLLAALAVALASSSGQFAWERELADMPARLLTIGLVLAGLTYCLTLPLINASVAARRHGNLALMILVIGVGWAIRLALLSSTPAFEDDWNRYLWDGAVTAQGLNPYRYAPAEALDPAQEAGPLPDLVEAAGPLFNRINHANIRTIYPPVAQGAFALAHWMAPWSLTAWRIVCLAGEAATLVLLLVLLRTAGRAPLWVALYWWNPVVAKELVNSAHMEAIVTPFVLSAVLLFWRGRHVAGAGTLGIAIGAKLWPMLLVPLLMRPLLATPRQLVAPLAILVALVAVWAAPIWLAGIDEASGFAAYAQHWQTNNALMPQMLKLAEWGLAPLSLAAWVPGLLVRGLLAVAVVLLALWLARAPATDLQTLMRRAGALSLGLFLASPAQFPWYLIWVLPFLPFVPLRGILVATALLPIYYVGFHYIAIGRYEVFRAVWVWIIWIPIWLALITDATRAWRAGRTADRNA